MKRFSKMLLAAFLIFTMAMTSVSVYTGGTEEIEFEDDAWDDAADNALPGAETEQHLTVASTTPPFGMFFTDMWSRNTSDLDVQSLLQGYNLIRWNGEEGLFGIDTSVVRGITVLENENGDRGFLLTLYDDLYYSDGTPITAWDYAFSWLLLGSREMGELGVSPEDLSWMAGYQEYTDGSVPYLAGVQVTAEDTLMIIVDHEAMPFFYEMGLLSCVPYPIHVLAPGVRVFDDGDGVYLANDPSWEVEPEETEETETEAEEDEETETDEEPRFTAELLAETILHPETGYLSHPSVVSGPYVLTSWDGKIAEFEKNSYYKGDLAGRLPVVDLLTYITIDNEAMVEAIELLELLEDLESLEENEENQTVRAELQARIHELLKQDTQQEVMADGIQEKSWLLNKVTDADTITYGMARIGDHSISMSNYARTGLAYITFSRNSKEVASKAVRQAIAWSMDRDELVNRYTGNFGLRVDGYYGIGQWMYGLSEGNTQPPVQAPENENDAQATAEYEAELQAWEDINLDDLTVYTLDLDQVRRILDADGWRRNAEGIREKDGIVLDLTLAYPEGNRIREAWEELLIPNLEEVGIRLTLIPMSMEELLDACYQQMGIGLEAPAEGLLEEDTLEELGDYLQAVLEDSASGTNTEEQAVAPDMFYLGSNFSTLFRPEDLFARYAPVENTALGLAPETEERADVIIRELEEELAEAEAHLEDHSETYVQEYLEPLEFSEDADLELAEEPEEEDSDENAAERIIRELTEDAVDSIVAEWEGTGEDADLSLADAASEEEAEPLAEEEVAGIYQDIYHYYLELYRDYGSLYALAMDMRLTEPGEVLEYMQKWVRFQKQFNDVLPMIPIYSNVYFDFYTSRLRNYNIGENITWGNAILGAYLVEEEPEPETEPETEPEPEAEEDDGLVEFDD